MCIRDRVVIVEAQRFMQPHPGVQLEIPLLEEFFAAGVARIQNGHVVGFGQTVDGTEQEMCIRDRYTVHLGGNLGRALLPVVDAIAATDVAVVELSSFQLISMRQSPEVAVVTNVTPNHLDHHKDMQEYIDAKRNILLYQKPDGKAVLGYENEVTRAMAADVKGSCCLLYPSRCV